MNVFKLIEDNGLNLHGDIEHFAELVAQQEREACAKVCDEQAEYWKNTSILEFAYQVASDEREACAAVADIALLGCERSIRDRVVRAIRARGEK
jgi:hypothetical protein